MPILLKRKNGEITPFRNAEYISAFYFIPKSILDKCGEEINSISRNPRKLLQDRRAIEVIESDLFKLVIIDAYAFMVWPFMGLGAKREIYSGYEPSWRYAHAASIPRTIKVLSCLLVCKNLFQLQTILLAVCCNLLDTSV